MPSDFIEEVRAERERQKSVEGWTAEHDDEYKNGELVFAASCYTEAAAELSHRRQNGVLTVPALWPWDGAWWKPLKRGLKKRENARRCMVKAGALLVAEAERLERLVAKGTPDAE